MSKLPWGLDGDCDEAIEVLDAREKAGFHGVVDGWRKTRKGGWCEDCVEGVATHAAKRKDGGAARGRRLSRSYHRSHSNLRVVN